MRYLFIIAIIYLVYKSLTKMLSNMKIVDPELDIKDQQNIEPQNHLHLNEDDIEDADFKDVD